mgnify:FL=1
MSYWVIGGVYENTSFDKIKEGESLEKFGPFSSYEDAKKEWDRISWENVDNCNVRFIILPHK